MLAVLASDAIRDLLLNSLLPDRKLRNLVDQPLGETPPPSDAQLVLWAFEDFLKRFYFRFLHALEVLLTRGLGQQGGLVNGLMPAAD